VTPRLSGSTIHTNIFIILQNLFIMLCWFYESDWLSCSNTMRDTSAKINISYSILFNLTTSYSSYFGGKKGISKNKTSFFLLMLASPGTLKGSGQGALTFCGCRWADKSAMQGCWTKGKCADGLSSVAWDTAAVVGECEGLYQGQVLWVF